MLKRSSIRAHVWNWQIQIYFSRESWVKVMDRSKSYSEYLSLKKSLKDSSTVIILDLE